MTIVQVITRSDTLAGAQLHVRDLSARLIESGHDAIVLVGGTGPFTEALRRAGIPFVSLRRLIRRLHPLFDCLAVLEIRGHLARLRPNVVATHSSKAGWVGRAAARLAGVPAVFTAHGWSFADGTRHHRRPIYAMAERLAAPMAAKIVTVSEYDRRLALRNHICSAKRIVTIHNGVHDSNHRGRPGEHRPKVRLVMVGRLDAQKDHRGLLQALSTLREEAWDLDVVGDGPLERHIIRAASELGVADRVRFLGLRSDVADLISAAQIGVLVSNYEGFPLVTLEYMRAGLPVVASDVCGVSEAVRDGRNGLLVPRGETRALAVALRRLIRDPALRAQFGAAGREDYVSEFTFDRMAESTLTLYRSVAAWRRDA